MPGPHPMMPAVGKFQGHDVELQEAGGQRPGMGVGVLDEAMTHGSNGVT